ncbi:hypothetical protein [Undibacterium sp. RuTC16W]|uniref:hypothetical protein n=1 Tax=Undibacterium sp. RuTC16W TaxID=3413048 RepID=UPI003BEF5FA7
MILTRIRPLIYLILIPLFVSCGGGSGGAATSSTATNTTTSTTTGTNTGTVVVPDTPPAAFEKRAAWLAARWGRSSRLLLGLGSVDLASMQKQTLKPDIYDMYLTGVGAGAWPTWNSPSGAYIQVVAKNADTIGAVPMFTLYQMAANGDGNLSGLSNASFMSQYWANVRLLFQQIKTYGKPALVNLEPDFWGYAQRASTNNDPSTVFAYVNTDADCSTLANNVSGVASCLLQIARKYAPNAYVGFPPALFGDIQSSHLSFMQQFGAGKADFIVMQTLDRDAGCFETKPQPSYCIRDGSNWYWDETNQTSPNFSEHFVIAKSFYQGLQLPILWWQTPLGVAATQSGSSGAWRDNRVRYFLTHASELVGAGGLGVVFSPGESHQTTINTDGGQYKTLSERYLSAPAALP